jgi:hypothetical protein
MSVTASSRRISVFSIDKHYPKAGKYGNRQGETDQEMSKLQGKRHTGCFIIPSQWQIQKNEPGTAVMLSCAQPGRLE